MQSDSFLITPAIIGLRGAPNGGPRMRVDGDEDARPCSFTAQRNTRVVGTHE